MDSFARIDRHDHRIGRRVARDQNRIAELYELLLEWYALADARGDRRIPDETDEVDMKTLLQSLLLSGAAWVLAITVLCTIAIATARADTDYDVAILAPTLASVVLETDTTGTVGLFYIQDLENVEAYGGERVTLGTITETLKGVSGDYTLDVLTKSAVSGGCDGVVLSQATDGRCGVSASFSIVDRDPSDTFEADPGLPPAVWNVGISVPWTDQAGNSGTATGSAQVTVQDDSAPEPSSLLLLGSGLIGLGGVLRRRLCG